MTALAGAAVQTVMLVVIGMAGDTFSLQRLFKFVRDMTVGAGNVSVRTRQRECRPGRVIEKRFSPVTTDMTERAIGSVKTVVRVVRTMTCVTLSRGV